MQLKLKQSLFLLLFVSFLTASAQKSTRFNGKPYLIYPQTIDVGYSGMQFTISESSLEFYNYNMPPVIGAVEDGEYLMYSTSFELKNKRKIGKDVVFDTVYHVFATVTIKNNKKEGVAKFYSRDNQVKPFAELPFQNDMINGSVRIIQNSNRYYPRRRHYDYYERDNYDGDYDYSPGGNMKYNAYVFELNFKDGVLDGLQKVRSCYGKRDTLETKSVTMSMGQKSGAYKKTTYYLKKKKPAVYLTTEGNYVKGEEEGEWRKTYQNSKTNYTLEIYNKGKQTAKVYFSGGKMESKTLYGKDSVMKYASNYKSDKHIPIVRNEYSYSYEYGQFYSDFVSFEYNNETSTTEYTYAIGDSARYNYYKLTQKYRNLRDTIINGYYIQISSYNRWKGGKSEVAYLIDSCAKKHYNSTEYGRRYDYNDEGSTYCKTELWDRSTDKKGKVTTVYTSTYDKLFTGDSLVSKLKYSTKRGALLSESYYQMALDYNYYNMKFTKGKYFNYQMYYVVSGGYKDGRILRVIKIPTHYDTLTLTDTLMLKGKKLYEYDENFYNAYDDFSDDLFEFYRDGRLDPKSNFNVKLMEFFTLKPVMHRSIYLGRKPFTGSFELNIKYKKNPNKIKGKVYEITQFFDFLAKKQIIELTVELDKRMLKKYYNTFMMPVRRMNFGIEEANFSGGASYYDIFRNQSVSTYFSSNKIVSELEFELYRINGHSKGSDYDYDDYDYAYEPDFYRSRYNRKRTKITLDNTYEVKASSIQFAEGMKHGQWHIVSNGTLERQYNFSKDKKFGMQYVYSGYNYNYLNYVYNAKRDTVNGKVWNLDMNGMPNYSGYFNMGVPDGYFVRYNDLDTTNRFVERYQFNKGYMVGRYELYRDSGQLKMTVDMNPKDSMYYDIYHSIPRMIWNYKKGKRVPSISESANTKLENPELSGSDFLTGIFSTSYIKKGNYKYYYKSGEVFSEGVKKDNNPEGQWNFYREGKDRIYKRIDFKDSIIEINGEDTFHSYGIVKAYYDDGRLMFKGLALDQETKYSCESEADIPTEEDYYLEFYDTVGKPVLVNGSGFIEELQANGYKLKEGRMVNGKKEGIWVYYSKFGLPNAIGAFENGKKSGRWLVGDLGGLNLSDKVCFMSNEEFAAWINTYGGNLSLKEEYYSEGKMMSGNMVDTIKR